MASRGLGTLTLDLVAKIGGFVGPLDQAERKLKTSTRSMTTSAVAFGTTIGNYLTQAINKVASALPAAIDAMDDLSKSAQKIGISTEALSQLAHAADLSDVSLEQLQGGLAKLTKFQAAAAQGNKEAVRTFDAFGIKFKDIDGNLRDTLPLLEDFAAIFQKLPDGPEKTALALQVFGKSGAELIPLLNSGADGLRDMAKEADNLGLTLSTQAGKEAEEFNDDLTRLKAKLEAAERQIATGLLPELIKLAEAFQAPTSGTSIADSISSELAAASHDIRATMVEIEYLKKAWKEQGIFGEGVFSVLQKADAEFQRREQLASGLALQGGPRGRGTARKGAAQGAADYAAAQAAKQAASIFSPPEANGKGGKSDAERAAEQLQEAYKRMNEQMAESIALYNQTGEAAKVRYQIEHGELAGLTQAQKDALVVQAEQIDQLAAEKQAREEAIRLEEEEAKAAKDHADQVKELLDDIAFETSLTKLSNDEKERAIILRRDLAGATEEEAKKITAAVDEMLAAQKHSSELSGAMDDFRASFSDAVTDVLTGSKSISDAFKSLADTIVAQIARIIANQVTDSLFGAPGSTSGGSAGGWLSSALSVFLPHHATGTDFAPGGPTIVGEYGPELVDMPRGARVTPNSKLRGGGDIHITINGGSNPRETAMQAGRELRRQLAFSGRS